MLLTRAIQHCETMRLVYRRQTNQGRRYTKSRPSTSGAWRNRPQCRHALPWAWCSAEKEPESHLVERIDKALPTGENFDGTKILRLSTARWRMPTTWSVPGDWA